MCLSMMVGIAVDENLLKEEFKHLGEGNQHLKAEDVLEEYQATLCGPHPARRVYCTQVGLFKMITK